MRTRRTGGASPPGAPEREVWLRSRETEAPADEAEWLLDLAAFAENRLDEDDAARVAALMARDPASTEDVFAARRLATATLEAPDPAIIDRAATLVGEEARVIAFPVRRSSVRPWYSAATWSGLAAAMVLAGWFGFNLGSGLSTAPTFGRAADEAAASDPLDPAPLLLRDLTESSQI